MDWGGWKRYALWLAIVLAAFAVFVTLYIWWPWWIDGARLRRPGLSTQDQSGILSGDRGDVLKIIAGAGAVVALMYTARKHTLDRKAHDLDLKAQELSRQVYALSEQGQVTDRYTKAITQLASEKMSERIGGIYALERIMADSERDHPTVVEVLAAFVRQRAPLPPSAPTSGDAALSLHPLLKGDAPDPDADVQAAVTVLARRPEREEPFNLDLRRCSLGGIELPHGARLAGASLQGTNLVRADLTGVDLNGALLNDANLSLANLLGAHLVGSSLRGVNLSYADLSRADLTSAYFWGANLSGAKLAVANLLDSRALVASQLSGAGLQATKLRPELLADAWVAARVKACEDWVVYKQVPRPTPNPAALPSSGA